MTTDYDNGGRLPYGFPYITSYSPVVPKLYWGVASQEQRIFEICKAIDSLGNTIYDISSAVNSSLDQISAISNKVNSLDERLTAVEAGDHTGGGGSADGSIGDRVTKLEQTTSSQASTISSIDGRVTSNANGIAGLVSSTNTLGDRVTALENASSSDPNGLAGRVTALENDNTVNKSDIKANKDAISGHGTRLNTIEQQVADQKDINTSTTTKINSLTDKVAGIDSELSDTSVNATTALSNSATALSTAKDASSKVTSMDGRVTTNASNISDLQDSMTSTNAKVSTNASDIKTLQDNATTDEKNIADLQNSLKTTNTTVDGISKDLATARTDIDGNKTGLANVKTSLNTLSDNMGKTNADLDAAKTSISDVTTTAGKNADDIASLKSSLSDTNKTVKTNTEAISTQKDLIDNLTSKTDQTNTTVSGVQKNINDILAAQNQNDYDIGQLKSQSSAHETSIQNNTISITGLNGDVGGLKKRVSDIEDEIKNQASTRGLQSRQGISEYVLTRDTDPTQPETPDINNIQQRLVTVEEGVGNLTTRADTMDRWGKSIETRVKALEDKKPTDSGSSDNTELASRVTKVETDLSTAQNDISTLKTSSEDYGKRIKAIEDKPGYDDTALVNRISAVESDNKTIHTNLDSNNTNINNHEGRIHAVELTLDGGKDADGNTVTALTDTVSSNTTRIKALEDKGTGSTDTGLADRVSKVETSVTDHDTRLTKMEKDLYDHKEENGSTTAGALTELRGGVQQAFGAIDEINTSLTGYYDPDKKESIPGLNQIVMNGWTDSTGTKHSPMTDRVNTLETSSSDYATRIKALEDKPAGGDTSALESRMTTAENNIKNAVYRLDNVVNGGQGSHGKFEDVLEECRVAVRDYLSTMYNVTSTSNIPDKGAFDMSKLNGLWNLMFNTITPKEARTLYSRMSGSGIWQLLMKTQSLLYNNGAYNYGPDSIMTSPTSYKYGWVTMDYHATAPFMNTGIDRTPDFNKVDY